MKLKITILSFFVCISFVLFSQNNPGSGFGSNNVQNTARNAPTAVLNGSQAIATSYTQTACGLNYVYASNPLFARTGYNYSVSVAQPATFSISGIPICGVIEKAFLYVSTSGDGVTFNASITNPILGNSIFPLAQIGSGPDKNWGFLGSYSYRADVTTIISGNGSYSISGIPTSSVNTGNDANGALLLIVYSDRTQTFSGSIVLADGNYVNAVAGGSLQTNITGFNVCGNPSLTTNFVLLDDQQAYGTTSLSMNSASTNYTLLQGAQQPWQLISSPDASVTTGQTSADFGLTNVADSIGLVMAGIYFQSDCLGCQQTLTLTATSTPTCLATASVNILGGLPPYTYTWTGSAQTSSAVTGLSAGVTTVSALDKLNCLFGTTTLNIITVASPLTVNNATVCPGISATLIAGAATSYTWSPPATLDVSSGFSVVASPSATTIYSIDFVNALGCPGTSTTEVYMDLNPAAPISVNSATICPGVSATLIAGAADSYTWSPPATLDVSNLFSVVATPSATTIYSIDFVNALGCYGTSTTQVYIDFAPAPPISVNSPTVCPGVSVTLSAGLANSYTWSPPGTLDVANAQNVVATTTATTIYTIDFISISGCVGTSTTEVTMNLNPATPIVVNDATVCPGVSANLNAGLALSYSWSPPGSLNVTNTQSVIASPTVATIYTINFTDIAGCVGTSTTSVFINLNPATPISVNSATICPNVSVTLNAGPAASYTWSPSGDLDANNIGTVIASPFVTTLYTIDFTDFLGCLGTSTAEVMVTNAIAAPLTVNSETVCAGLSATLAASAANSYLWYPSSNLSSANTQSVISTPMTTTTYSIDYQDIFGCQGTATTQVVVSFTNTFSINNSTLCAGQSINLSNLPVTGDYYFWRGPLSFASVLAAPTITNATTAMSGEYSLSISSVAGCTSTAVSSVTVFPNPILIVGNSSPICINTNFNLTSSGGITYNWVGPNSFSSASQNTNVIGATLVNAGIYTVTSSFPNGCVSTGTTNVIINSLPIPNTIPATGTNVCVGRPNTFSVTTPFSSYQWLGPNGFSSVLQGTTFIVSAAANGVYTITVTGASGCQGVKTVTIAALVNPTVSISVPTVCVGFPATFTANGAGFFTWYGPNGFYEQNFTTTASIAAANFSSIGTYSCILTSAFTGCSANAQANFTVLPLPNATATGTNVCLNSAATLTAGGGVAYQWTGPNSYTSNVALANIPVADPTSTGVYSVMVTAANSCTNVTTTTLGTVPLPTVTATGTLICLNEPFTIAARGAVTYSWTGPSSYTASGANAFVPIVNNLSTGVYSVIATAANTCTGSTTVALATLTLPIIITTGTAVCINQPAVLKAQGGLSNGTGYSWKGPGGYQSFAQNAVIPSANSVFLQTYTVVAMAPNSCTNVSTATLATIPRPIVLLTGNTVCFGEPAVISASGANTYTWSGPNSVNTSGSATNTIQVVNLQSSGIYTVIGRAVTGCTNVATGTLNTIPLPIITTTGTTVCFLEPATLAASGGTPNAYTWRGPGGYSSSSQNAYIPSATSAAPQTYTVVGTAANSCTNSATAVLKTYPLPRPVYNSTANVCVGDYVTLQAYGAVTYTWAGPRNFRSLLSEVSFPTYSLSQSGDFTLTVIDSLGCRNYTTANVIVNALPEGNLTSNNDGNFCVPYCADFSIVRTTPNPIITTNWSLYGKKTVGDIFNYCASNAASNTVVCVFTDALGCTNTHSFEIAAYPTPTANFLISAEKAVESIDEVLFTNNSTGQQITNNNWFFIETGKPISSEKNASFLFENAGQYAIALMVTNTWGCSDTTVKSLIVESDFKIFVPNAFTPNFDGLNDFFQPKGRGIAKYTLEIFDRWGNKIFFSDEFEKPWDGKLNGDNCLNDVYGWRIFITDVKGQKHDLSGQVTLIR